MSDPKEGNVSYDEANGNAIITIPARPGIKEKPIALPLLSSKTVIRMAWILSTSMASYQFCPSMAGSLNL